MLVSILFETHTVFRKCQSISTPLFVELLVLKIHVTDIDPAKTHACDATMLGRNHPIIQLIIESVFLRLCVE